MKYLLTLLIILCGCSNAIKENNMTIYSVNQGDQVYKYTYTIRAEIDSQNREYIYIKSNQEFSVGDTVKLSLKENENVE